MNLYDRVRFAYLTAAVAMVVAAGGAATVRAWFALPAAVALLALTIWQARRVLGRIKRGDIYPRDQEGPS